MPFSPSGVYSPPPGTFAETNTVISSEAYNNFLADLETSLSSLLLKNGVDAMEADLNMGSKQVKNMAAGTAPSDGVRFSQIFPVLRTKWMSPPEETIEVGNVSGPQWDLLGSSCIAVTNTGGGSVLVTRFGSLSSPFTGPWFLRFPQAGVTLVNNISLRCPLGEDYTVPVGGSILLLPFSTTNNTVPNAYNALAFP